MVTVLDNFQDLYDRHPGRIERPLRPVHLTHRGSRCFSKKQEIDSARSSVCISGPTGAGK